MTKGDIESINKSKSNRAKITAIGGIIAAIIAGTFQLFSIYFDKENTIINTNGQQGGTTIGNINGPVIISNRENNLSKECEKLKSDARILMNQISNKFPKRKYSERLDREAQYYIEELDKIKDMDCSIDKWNSARIIMLIDSSKHILNE